MQSQTLQRSRTIPRFAPLFAILVLAGGLLLSASPLLAEGPTRSCDLTGTWYGGSVVAYHMTIVPAAKPGHFTVSAQGMYKNSVMNTAYTGEVARRHHRYEGSLMQLTTSDPDFLNPPPIGKMPDIIAVWSSMELVDCNTIQNTIPFFGMYFASNIWQPGIDWVPVPPGKVPLLHPPDVDLLNVLANVPTGGPPIVETYHRLLMTIDPALLH